MRTALTIRHVTFEDLGTAPRAPVGTTGDAMLGRLVTRGVAKNGHMNNRFAH